jgi:NAD(P)-dependent dehydrogenase (short-subunit alcohol dehydrogenase family)
VSAAPGPGAALITGASTGIGRACALKLDSLGWRVFAGVRRPADAEDLRGAGSERLTPVTLDVTDPDSIATAVSEIAESSPAGLAGLVNNAGIAVSGPLEFVPLKDLRKQLEVNVVGLVAVTQAALELVRRAGGRVVNVGSVGGRTALPFVGPYAASKYAVEALTDSLRRELRPWGIHVAVIEPGAIDTPIWEKGKADADRLGDQLPAQAFELYGAAMGRLRELADERAAAGLPPDAVAARVVHALTASRPRTRYLIGREAKLQVATLGLLPDRVGDRIVARLFRARGAGSAGR